MKQCGQSPSSTDLFRASVCELLLYIPKATAPRAQEPGLCRWEILALKFAFCLPSSVSWASCLTSRGHRTPAGRWEQPWCLAQNTQIKRGKHRAPCWASWRYLVPGIHLFLLLLIIQRVLCEMCTLPAPTMKIYWSAGGGRAGIGISLFILQRGVQGGRSRDEVLSVFHRDMQIPARESSGLRWWLWALTRMRMLVLLGHPWRQWKLEAQFETGWLLNNDVLESLVSLLPHLCEMRSHRFSPLWATLGTDI